MGAKTGEKWHVIYLTVAFRKEKMRRDALKNAVVPLVENAFPLVNQF
jgi:hypothetical protein